MGVLGREIYDSLRSLSVSMNKHAVDCLMGVRDIRVLNAQISLAVERTNERLQSRHLPQKLRKFLEILARALVRSFGPLFLSDRTVSVAQLY